MLSSFQVYKIKGNTNFIHDWGSILMNSKPVLEIATHLLTVSGV